MNTQTHKTAHPTQSSHTVVVLGVEGLGPGPSPASVVGPGKHLTPSQFHQLIQSAPANAVLLDCRNDYESHIGQFLAPNIPTVAPPVRNFKSFPRWVDEHAEELSGKTILMYCTGGIRCERGSAYLRTKGLEPVQLYGGIHTYLEQYPDGFFKGFFSPSLISE